MTSPLAFASYYGDHMVLQRAPARAIVWGYSSKVGSTLTVTLSGHSGVTTTVRRAPFQDGGIWMVKLPAESRPGPFTIKVVSSEEVIQLNDVLFGDVWICSGQSNMQFSVKRVSIPVFSLLRHFRYFISGLCIQ